MPLGLVAVGSSSTLAGVVSMELAMAIVAEEGEEEMSDKFTAALEAAAGPGKGKRNKAEPTTNPAEPPIVSVHTIQGVSIRGEGPVSRLTTGIAGGKRTTLAWTEHGIHMLREQVVVQGEKTEYTPLDSLIVPWTNIREIRLQLAGSGSNT
jgi:hypothetical protein